MVGMMNRARRRTRTTGAKEKKSFTLSPSSVTFLERLRKEKKAASTSRVLDELIEDAAARRQIEAMDKAFTAYYDSLTDEEMEEDRAWGEFAESQWRPETK
jgi:hypothetical protein